ncbi:MAG: MerR family DNA-binding transcriptional regulator [Nitrospira defluvii]|nr:MerR family DNA-binding transcriptional regulator [Nitrospira defluvii]
MTAGRTVGQLAKAVGVNVRTVRYSERLKLLTPIFRRPSGYRVYGEHEEWQLRCCDPQEWRGASIWRSSQQ